MEFFALDFLGKVPADWQPTLTRTKSLISAIRANRDFTLLECRYQIHADRTILECLIVEVKTDEVPHNNSVGIQYIERTALLIYPDEAKLIDVRMLRTNFPKLLHTNSSVTGEPSSLCLYFEPDSAVLRTWTPQKFLRRIQWWLAKVSCDELHAADQPVEQAFFVTPYEIILPSNFNEAIKVPESACQVVKQIKRPNGGISFILEVLQKSRLTSERNIYICSIETNSIVSGLVEDNPSKLGELVSILNRRGVTDVISQLRNTLRDNIEGTSLLKDEPNSALILLLRIPVSRTVDSQPERTILKAFLFDSGHLKVGVAIGAYLQHEGKYYADVMGSIDDSPQALWQSETLTAMEVLVINTSAQSRSQSGINDAGPSGGLIGAGSLGSALLNIWTRCGWGRWSVIDKDHIKPHNLVRHTAFISQIGMLKINAVNEISKETTGDISLITPLYGDATDLTGAVFDTLKLSELIIDASADLGAPRAISRVDQLKRCITVFITPDGNSSVMLAEDSERHIRQNSLESQYYRALINNTWGKEHLQGHLGTYWSGASCRDISFTLPYSRVLAHAALLSEQIQNISTQTEAAIKIWSRDPVLGTVIFRNIQAFKSRTISFLGLTLFLDEGLEQKLRMMRTAKIPHETGGILLGYYDLVEKIVVLVDACSAPTDSISTATSFERGIDGVSEYVAEVSFMTAGIVGYVGEWHSHPPGHSASASSADIIQLSELAQGMAVDGFPAFSLIVGENEINVFQGLLQ